MTIAGQPELRPQSFVVPGDPSSAGFPTVAAACAAGSDGPARGCLPQPAAHRALHHVARDGRRASRSRTSAAPAASPWATWSIRGGALRGVEVPAERAPAMIDEYPILAVAAALARGTTIMRGLAELRVKESDRLATMADGLAACGVAVEVEGDDLIVHGGPTPAGGVHDRRQARPPDRHELPGPGRARGANRCRSRVPRRSRPASRASPRLMNGLGARSRRSRRRLERARSSSPSTGRPPRARARWRGGWPQHFQLAFLDTGLLYRAVARAMLDRGLRFTDEAAAVAAATALAPQDVEPGRLRGEGIGQGASIVAAVPAVRAALLPFQRRFGAGGRGAVLAGPRRRHGHLPGCDLQAVRHRQRSGAGAAAVRGVAGARRCAYIRGGFGRAAGA